MDESQAVYTGMKIVRMVDGEAQDLSELKKDVQRRVEMIGKLNDRRMAYVAAGDGESLLRLAEEYKSKKMPVMANIVRKEAERWTVSRRQTSRRRKAESRPLMGTHPEG